MMWVHHYSYYSEELRQKRLTYLCKPSQLLSKESEFESKELGPGAHPLKAP
jgi:hypothetical protein